MVMKPLVLALAVLGAEPDGPPAAPPIVATQVRILEMKDLSWRSAAYAQLTPVTRRDGATIWTAPADVLAILEQRATQSVQAPKVNAVAGQPATVKTAHVRPFVAGTKFIETTLDNGKSGVAFLPDMGQATDGFQFEVVARPIDQGTLAKIQLKTSRVGAIHQVPVNDPRGQDAPNRLNATYQVPEMAQEQVAGEWVIPKDGLLVIGLGPETTLEKDGKTARVRECVVVVQATPGRGALGAMPAEPVMGREVIYSSPAFAAPAASPSVSTAPPSSLPDAFDASVAVPKPPIGSTAHKGNAPHCAVVAAHRGHVGIHPVHVLAALPWNAVPGPVGTAAQARVMGIGGPVVKLCEASQQQDQMVRRTGAEEVEPAAIQPMPSVPSRTLPGTITPDGTRAVLPPLPDHDADPASYDPTGEPRPSPQTVSSTPQNVKIHGKVVISGADGLELIADGLTIRTLPKSDAAVAPTSATLKPAEPVTPPCCDVSDKEKSTGWSKPKDVAAASTVAAGAAPLKLRLPNSQGAVELEIHPVPAP